MKLSWKNFKNLRFMINCKTQEEANELCQMMDNEGMSWCTCGNYVGNTKWNDYENHMCYSGDGHYASRSFYESKGYKIITFKKFKKYQDQKQLSKVEWCTDGSLPDKSGNYLVISEGGGLTVLTYSRVHRLFNVADAFSAEVANKYAIKVKAWVSFDKLNVPEQLLVM